MNLDLIIDSLLDLKLAAALKNMNLDLIIDMITSICDD